MSLRTYLVACSSRLRAISSRVFDEPTRPLRWEDDISRNHNSVDDFENIILPNELAIENYTSSYLWAELGLSEQKLHNIISRDSYHMPSEKDREGYNLNADRDYFLSGYLDYTRVLEQAANNKISVNSLLDFGCASGRVLRHFGCQSDIENLWGADINGRHVKFIEDYLPEKIKAIHTSALPYFPISDGAMDVVTAFSVFTHIDTFESAWLAEIYRVLRPGGMAYLSIHNDDTWTDMWSPEQDKRSLFEQLSKSGVDISKYTKESIPNGKTNFRYTELGPYRGWSFHSNDYIRTNWGRFFKVACIKSRHHGINQAVVVLIKP